ncbi:LAMI_0C09582g1_1 [Lachancea mirantina]|uniref:LAMI_0C09582g1_1 n=1 Tax=Lachancea mirantina TaxID=1230905 RepID=A0A1G4J583_9SACH|nr:LAMI_0C09582g1_1 [Lachancea mirantina]
MASEISLEETNKFRISLGLKPIPVVEPSARQASVVIGANDEKTDEHHEALNSSERDEITTDGHASKHLKLAWHIERAKAKLRAGNLTDEPDESEDWLSTIKKTPEGAPEGKPPGATIRQKTKKLLSGRDNAFEEFTGESKILTLKEKDVHERSDEEDILVDHTDTEMLEQSEAIRLKRLNAQRRRFGLNPGEFEQNAKGLAEQSFELTVKDGVINRKPTASRTQQNFEVPVGKRRLSLPESSSEDESAKADYAPVKFKKRMKKGKNINYKRVKVPSELPKVELIDEDLGLEPEIESSSVLVIRPQKALSPNTRRSAEEIAAEIAKEERERKQRARDVAKSGQQNSVSIDENQTFLESLRGDILAKPEQDFQFKAVDISAPAISNAMRKVEQRDADKGMFLSENEDNKDNDDDSKPNFYDGMAATVNFLKDSKILPTTTTTENLTQNGSSTDALLKLKQQIEVRRVQERVRKDVEVAGASYTKEELRQIKDYEDREIAAKAAAIQHERLENYNPEVKLKYTDDRGNELTTKEAYKKLSQAFHGTKSNRKKREKASKKIDDRRKQQESNYLGI